MTPPLRERLRWRNSIRSGIDATATRAAMARAGALLAAAGAVVWSVGGLLAGDGVERLGPLLACAAIAAVTAVTLIAVYDRLPMWGFHALAAGATVLTSVAVYAWGADSAYGPLAYVWVTVYVFCFFPLAPALAHLALLGAAYAAVLSIGPAGPAPGAAWLATVGTLGTGGVLVALALDRLRGLMAGFASAAYQDPLTLLLNRRGFERVFDAELERARRSGTPLSVLVGDLDRFKSLNDELGHAAGDEALRNAGRAMDSAKRSFDTAARVGGEEFALLAPDCDEMGAYLVAERVRSEVERSCTNGNLPLTASFGIATFPLHGQTAEALLGAADRALYAAKRLGRNRTVISNAELPHR